MYYKPGCVLDIGAMMICNKYDTSLLILEPKRTCFQGQTV